MALSGTFITNIGGYWRLRLVWSATQSVSNNTSTITNKLYWEDRSSGGYGAVYSSSTRSGYNKIGTGYTDNFTTTAGLSARGSKLLRTSTHTVNHNDNGTLSLSLTGMFDLSGISLSGVDHGVKTVGGTVTLNTIPRASSISSSGNWTAGSNATVSISRASSTFNHTVEIYVKNTSGSWVQIKSLYFSTSQTSLSTSFSTAENTEIFQTIAGRSSADSRMIVKTYDSGDYIGNSTEDGTVTAPAASVTNSSFDHYVYADETINIGLSVQNSAFTHTVVMKLGSFTKTLTGVGSSTSWTPSTSEQNSLYAQMPNDKYKDGTIEVTTYYGGQKVRSTTTSLLQFHVRNSNPTFSSTQIAYDDTNSATIAITGDASYLIQSRSTLRARIISAATPNNGSSIVNYVISANGISKTVTATGYHTIGVITTENNATLSVTAVDSRGLSTTVTKTIKMIPYSTPSVITTAERVNGYEEDTIIALNGGISPLVVGTVAKNAIVSAQYQYREQGIGEYSPYTNFTIASTIPTYTATDVSLVLDNLKAWDVRVTVKDKLGETTVDNIVVVGQPILFIDSAKKSIGFNDFPQNPNEFRVNGRMVFGQNMWANGIGGEGNTAGAIDMNNSDIVKANGIYFNDVAGNDGEGLLFLKSGAAAGSANSADYDNLYMQDGYICVNNQKIMEFQAGTSTGSGVMLGAGGRTIVGSGESGYTTRDNTTIGTGSEYLIMSSDEDIHFYTNLQQGWASKQEFRFDQNGYFHRPKYKEPNGYNVAAIRSNSAHDDHMVIQTTRITLPMSGGQSFTDISFPIIFTSEPDWVLAVSTDANASATNISVYNTTTSGCRIYGVHTSAYQPAYTTYVTIVACGRRQI